jgi:ribosome-binding factor A
MARSFFMSKEFTRVDRLSQQMQQEIAVILQREIKDPRLHSMITVSDVDVSKDLSHAKIYVTFLGLDSDKVAQNLQILNDAAGFVRSLIGRRIQARIVPSLRFYFDKSLDEGIRMANLVESVRRSDAQKRIDAGQIDAEDAVVDRDEEE